MVKWVFSILQNTWKYSVYADNRKLDIKFKANNNQITDSEIETLLEDVKSKPNSGETSNNGKGISIGYTENDETYQFQVLRLYK